MAETASVDLSKEHAEMFVGQLSHEARAILRRAVFDATIDLDLLEECGLEQLNIGQLESGTEARFICPHVGCEEMFHPSKLRWYGWHQRRETPAAVTYGDPAIGNGRLSMYADGESDGEEWRVNVFFCPSCDRPVQQPAKWNVTY